MLTVGLVVLDANGQEVTVTGELGALYTLLRDGMLVQLVAQGIVLQGPELRAAKLALVEAARPLATWAVEMLTLRANVAVAGSVAALQRTPNPNNPGAATVGHGGVSPVLLPIV